MASSRVSCDAFHSARSGRERCANSAGRPRSRSRRGPAEIDYTGFVVQDPIGTCAVLTAIAVTADSSPASCWWRSRSAQLCRSASCPPAVACWRWNFVAISCQRSGLRIIRTTNPVLTRILRAARLEALQRPDQSPSSQPWPRPGRQQPFQSLISSSCASAYGPTARTDLAHRPVSHELSFGRRSRRCRSHLHDWATQITCVKRPPRGRGSNQ